MPDSPANQSQTEPSEAESVRRLEAVLMMARSPMTARKLGQLASLRDGKQCRSMVRELNRRYDGLGRAFHIKRIAGGYQMFTRPQFADWIGRLKQDSRRIGLSRSAMETLAIVAYRQPIIKADIEAIRGVSSGEMLRQLLEASLVRIVGRSENLGRPYLYGTSREFLATFGFASINDLPRADQLAGHGLPDWDNPDENQSHESLSISHNECSDVKETQT